MEMERGAFDAMRHARKRKRRAWTCTVEAPAAAAVGGERERAHLRTKGGWAWTHRQASIRTPGDSAETPNGCNEHLGVIGVWRMSLHKLLSCSAHRWGQTRNKTNSASG